MSEKDSFPISLCATAGGIVLTAAVVSILYTPSGIDIKYMLFFCGLLAIFQVAGLITGSHQWHTTAGKAGAVLAWLGIAVIITILMKVFPQCKGFFAMMLVPAVLMGVIAGLAVATMQTKGLLYRWRVLLVLWLAPALWFGLFWAFPSISGNHGQPAQPVTGAVSILFGPWATLAARLGSWPSAGGFFDPAPAAVMTLILILLVALTVWIKKTPVAALLLIFYAAFIWSWSITAVVQLLNCLA